MDILSKPMTPEEQQKVVALRTEFSDVMNSHQTKSFQDEKQGILSPESVKQIFKKIEINQEWLVQNKNAKYVEIFSKYQDYKSAIKTIKDSDVPRRKLSQVIQAFPFLSEIFMQRKHFTEDVKKKLLDAHTTLKTWYDKSAETADVLTLQQKYQEFLETIRTLISNPDKQALFVNEVQGLSNVRPDLFPKVLEKLQVEEKNTKKKVEATPLDAKEIVSDTSKKVYNTVFVVLQFTLKLFAASLAANMAIVESPAIRILYFLFTFFVPGIYILVILGAIVLRFYKGQLPLYALLPLTTTSPGETTLGRLLKKPFYWIEDEAYKTMMGNWTKALKDAVA